MSVATVPDILREQVAECPHCGRRNRLRELGTAPQFRCGACQTELPSPFPSPEPPVIGPEARFRPSTAGGSRTPSIAFRDLPAKNRAVSPEEVQGVVDAFTGELLKPALGLFQCDKCLVFYHKGSVELLRLENGGQCVACLSVALRAVALAPSRRGFRPATEGKPAVPVPVIEHVTLINYREHIGQLVTFEGFVPRVLTSRNGRHFAVMFQNLDWSLGFKATVLHRHLDAVGGELFVQNLQGHTIQVRGLVQQHPNFGCEILVTERNMILAIR